LAKEIEEKNFLNAKMIYWTLIVIGLWTRAFAFFSSSFPLLNKFKLIKRLEMSSKRVENTEQPYIENILDKYAGLPNVTSLALGSSYWGPPIQALEDVKDQLFARDSHRYGNLFGLPALRDHLIQSLSQQGVDTKDMDIMITAGANQAFTNIALALCDSGDHAIIIAPYYFSHLLALQLSEAQTHICPFEPETLYPDWTVLEQLISTHKPKIVVVTTPNNPSGKVWSKAALERLIRLCASTDSYLVVDQTYYEFLYDNDIHTFPTGYEKLVHVFSLSKVYGLAGWRVGYTLFSKSLTEDMRKVNLHFAYRTSSLCNSS
jgi:aromatic aminotransferase